MTIAIGRRNDTQRDALVIAITLAIGFAAALATAGPYGYLMPVAVLGMAGSGYVVLAAMQGRRWALCGILCFALVVPNIGFVQRDIHDTSTLDPQNALKIVLWAAMAAIALARWRSYSHLLRDGVLFWLAIFAGIAIASTAWSPVRIYTGIGAVGLAAALGFCCTIAAEVPRATLLRTVTFALVAYLVINTVAMLALPTVTWAEDEIGTRFQGVSTHPNILAKEFASFICLFTPLALAEKRIRLAIFLVLASLAIMVPTGSRTAILGVLLAFVLPLAMHRRARGPMAIAIALFGILVLALAVGWRPDLQMLVGEASRDAAGSDVMTLTGRTELWSFVWDKIQYAPIFGYGFISANDVLSTDWWGPTDASVGAHNSWLQTLLTLGIVGFVPFLMMHVELWRRWFQGSRYLRLVVPFLTILGLTEIEMAAQPVLVTLVAFLLAALDTVERKNE